MHGSPFCMFCLAVALFIVHNLSAVIYALCRNFEKLLTF